MSDNTANAREPSMEDILASIRRIIDEEDTRDARPASDHLSPVENRGRATQDGSLPVMAAAAVNRDDEDVGFFDETDELGSGSNGRRTTVDALGGDALDDDALDDDEGDSVFPERESPFWSRATGRDASDSAPDGEKNDEDYAGAFDADSDRDRSGEDAALDDASGTRTDIFTRAQNKLEGTPRLSTRERMQSLAARAEERAEETAKADVVAPSFGRLSDDDDGADEALDLDRTALTSLDDVESGPLDLDDVENGLRDGAEGLTESAEHVAAQASTEAPTSEDADVLDLTDSIERAEASGEISFTPADGTTSSDSDRYDGDYLEDASGQHDASSVSTLPESIPPETTESSSWERDTDETRDRSHDMDDVLDLTTPLGGLAAAAAVGTGNVESGETFHVSGVEEDDAADGAIEDAISRNLVQDDANREESAGFDALPEFPDAEIPGIQEDDTLESETLESETLKDEAPANTYSRFDTIEETESLLSETTEDDVEDTYSAAFVTLDDVPSPPDLPELEDATPLDPEEPVAASLLDEDGLEPDENIGFPDTFGASDVYHDDPPALDEDYSRSLGAGDELAAEQAAFAAQMQKDDRMEAVGGMVRDAMERDPVDYSDPAALVSMTSEEISARALASLADVEGEASRRVYGALKISEDGSGAEDSLEGMVRGMLKPMLREWLDDNLPTVVESAVRGEVERISSKSRKYSRAADND